MIIFIILRFCYFSPILKKLKVNYYPRFIFLMKKQNKTKQNKKNTIVSFEQKKNV